MKEQANVRDMKLETLNFRCEKLQEDITKKHEQMTNLKMKLGDKEEIIDKMRMQLAKAERENRINKEELAPRLEALKSRYEVCMLEMVSLENDNKIMNERIQRLLKENSELRRSVRDMKKQKFEEKQQRLTLCREFEMVKRTLDELTDKMTDIHLEKEDLFESLKRVKNESLTNQKKIQLLERENGRLNTILLSKGMISNPEFMGEGRSHNRSRPEMSNYRQSHDQRMRSYQPEAQYSYGNQGVSDPNNEISYAKRNEKYNIESLAQEKEMHNNQVQNIDSLALGMKDMRNSFEKPDERNRAIDSKDTVYVETNGEETLQPEHVDNEIMQDHGNDFDGIIFLNVFIHNIYIF